MPRIHFQRHWLNLSDPAAAEAARAKNRTKSKVLAKIEHAIGVVARVFGFTKVRYRGLDKNAHRLFVARAPANSIMARRHRPRRRGA